MLNSKIIKFCQVVQIRFRYQRKDTPLPIESLLRLNKKPAYQEVENYPDEFTVDPPKGRIYDKKAFPIFLQADKKYLWCRCGISKSQPICDGSHLRLDGTDKIKKRHLFRPIEFQVSKSATYHLCNCKQSGNRPFCDGTHRKQEIQEAVKG